MPPADAYIEPYIHHSAVPCTAEADYPPLPRMHNVVAMRACCGASGRCWYAHRPPGALPWMLPRDGATSDTRVGDEASVPMQMPNRQMNRTFAIQLYAPLAIHHCPGCAAVWCCHRYPADDTTDGILVICDDCATKLGTSPSLNLDCRCQIFI